MRFRDERSRFAEQFDLKPQVFSDSVITVELPRDAARRHGNVRTFLLAVNLLSRTFGDVHVVFPAGTAAHRHPWHLDTVDAVINELRNTVDGTLIVGPPARSNVVLSIGAGPSLLADRQVMVCGSHWQAALDCDLPGAGEGVLGPLYAATMGAAQVLLHTLEMADGTYRTMAPFSFSLLNLLPHGPSSHTMPPVSLPEAHLVGVGAVGSAAVYALAHLDDVRGTLHLIDNETVDDSNRKRYLLMRRGDIGEKKVDVAGEALRDSAIDVTSYPGVFAGYVKDYPEARVNLLLSPVDSEEGRRALARMLPRRIINAATGGTTVTLSTHGFADGKACLHCLYLLEANQPSQEEIMAADMGLPPDTIRMLVETNEPVGRKLVARIEQHRDAAPGEWAGHVGSPIHSFYAKAVCGDAAIDLPTANVIAPLPFISAAAGILLAAELTKMGHADLRTYTLDNYFRVDTLEQPQPEFRWTRSRDPSGRCICRDSDYVDAYSEKYVAL